MKPASTQISSLTRKGISSGLVPGVAVLSIMMGSVAIIYSRGGNGQATSLPVWILPVARRQVL